MLRYQGVGQIEVMGAGDWRVRGDYITCECEVRSKEVGCYGWRTFRTKSQGRLTPYA
jgi:hypothetical protein